MSTYPTYPNNITYLLYTTYFTIVLRPGSGKYRVSRVSRSDTSSSNIRINSVNRIKEL